MSLEDRMNLNYRQTFLLGLGFMVVSMVWAGYNAYMPIFLGKYTDSNTLIGFVMVWDNIANIILLPIIGAMSDNTRTKIGRRMPYIIIGMPLAGIAYALLPLQKSFLTLIAIDLVFNVIIATYRSPVIALMPDITAEHNRSKANGVINFMGGLGSLIMFFIGSQLYKVNNAYPFFLVAILSFIVPIVLFFGIKEPKIQDKSQKQNIFKSFLFLVKDKNKAPFFTLLSIFTLIAGFSSIETFFTRYAEIALKINPAISSFSLGFYSIAFIAFALPAGFIATKIGKKYAMMVGAIGSVPVLIIFATVTNFTVFEILLPIAGALNAMFTINSYPLVVSYASSESTGTYTGLYYLFSSLASIIAPPVFGLLMDLVGFNMLFVAGAVSMFASFIFLIFIKDHRRR
ncbi:MFS transporter [Athalassotoga saccharophila]|uniref:MFS transporter n=1 Tax=Athalassotoga saccharophila TaxID=1441386 RepID=UPI0013799A94|nr:MFS transporter [Athalassotoga saccharophila]